MSRSPLAREPISGHFCHLMPDAQIGPNCNLGQNVYVDRGVVIGDGCKIQNNVSIYKGVTLWCACLYSTKTDE